MCTNSVEESLRGSTFGAILRTNEITTRSFAGRKVKTSTRLLFAGGCGFLFAPHLQADSTPLVWLPQLDPATVLLVPATDAFSHSRSLVSLTPIFRRRASDGEHWIVADAEGRFPLLLMGGLEIDTPVASVSPFDPNFAARTNPALRLWRLLTGQRSSRPADGLTRLQRRQLLFGLRALDGHLAGATYREIAEVLFDEARIPAGPSWKTHDLRGRTIRLVRTGSQLMRGGYIDLLGYTRRRRR
jgi:hypothetical protein